MTTGHHATTSQDVELQRDEHLALDAVELLWRSSGVRQVPASRAMSVPQVRRTDPLRQ